MKKDTESIYLTDEQKKERFMRNIKAFEDGLKKLSQDTGITLKPTLKISYEGIIPSVDVVEYTGEKADI